MEWDGIGWMDETKDESMEKYDYADGAEPLAWFMAIIKNEMHVWCGYPGTGTGKRQKQGSGGGAMKNELFAMKGVGKGRQVRFKHATDNIHDPDKLHLGHHVHVPCCCTHKQQSGKRDSVKWSRHGSLSTKKCEKADNNGEANNCSSRPLALTYPAGITGMVGTGMDCEYRGRRMNE
jgi:hypothetical protein